MYELERAGTVRTLVSGLLDVVWPWLVDVGRLSGLQSSLSMRVWF